MPGGPPAPGSGRVIDADKRPTSCSIVGAQDVELTDGELMDDEGHASAYSYQSNGRGHCAPTFHPSASGRGDVDAMSMNAACLQALEVEVEVREAAVAAGLTLRANVVQCGETAQTLHWMFNDAEGRRLADYWPGSGSIRINGVTSKVASPFDALITCLRYTSDSDSDLRNLDRQLF